MKYIKRFDNILLKNKYNKNLLHTMIYKLNSSVFYDNGYIPLKYIRSSSTGGQYIILDKLFNESPINFTIDMLYMIYGHGKDGDDLSAILSAVLNSNPYPGFCININQGEEVVISCEFSDEQSQLGSDCYYITSKITIV